jgi:hypothetical protein
MPRFYHGDDASNNGIAPMIMINMMMMQAMPRAEAKPGAKLAQGKTRDKIAKRTGKKRARQRYICAAPSLTWLSNEGVDAVPVTARYIEDEVDMEIASRAAVGKILSG